MQPAVNRKLSVTNGRRYKTRLRFFWARMKHPSWLTHYPVIREEHKRWQVTGKD